MGVYTKRGIPWIPVYSEVYKTKTEALKRESEIKKKKSRKYIEELIIHAEVVPIENREVSLVRLRKIFVTKSIFLCKILLYISLPQFTSSV